MSCCIQDTDVLIVKYRKIHLHVLDVITKTIRFNSIYNAVNVYGKQIRRKHATLPNATTQAENIRYNTMSLYISHTSNHLFEVSEARQFQIRVLIDTEE